MKLYKTIRKLTCKHKHKALITTIMKGTFAGKVYFRNDVEIYRCLKCGKEFFIVKKEKEL